MKKLSDLTLKKLGKEIKNQTPNTALQGRGSQHAPTAPALSREEKRTFLSSML